MTQLLSSSPRPTLLREAVDTFRVVAVGLAIASTLHATLYQPFTIPTPSMEPELQVGDYLVVSKFSYGWSWASLPVALDPGEGRLFGRSPRRGDVVVFRLPRAPKEVWIKRVIGLPGDRVAMRGGQIILDGKVVEQRLQGSGRDGDGRPVQVQWEQLPGEGAPHSLFDQGAGFAGDDRPERRVPAGHYLVMGDNRDNSLDGRWPGTQGVGLLPASHLLGRAEVIVASWEPGASLFAPWTWVRLREGRLWKPIR